MHICLYNMVLSVQYNFVKNHVPEELGTHAHTLTLTLSHSSIRTHTHMHTQA